MGQKFVHLHVHTEYSLVDGLLQIKPFIRALPPKGMHAIAVTDQCNLFAAVKFFQTAIDAGVKPIIGADITCQNQTNSDQYFSLVLLCMDQQGYKNLTCLVSQAYQHGQYKGQVSVQQTWVEQYAAGLIALSGGIAGDVGQAIISGNEALARERAQYWSSIFPQRFYLEISRTGRTGEELYNERLVALAQELSLPIVATNDVRFLEQTDFEAHEARVCIYQGCTLNDPKRSHSYSPQQYLRSEQEMCELFSDLPCALENTLEITKRCNLRLDLGAVHLPRFSTPDGITVEAYLSELSTQGLSRRLEHKTQLAVSAIKAQQVQEKELEQIDRVKYEQRLHMELEVINSMGFAGYFLIVADFIQWAKQNGVPVGPGRGSGAGSLVAYALNITDLDPLEYELLFERFLNPERVSMPDFDVDFCMEGRDRVIEYVTNKYGRQSVSQIITFGTMAAKAVVRDVGRVLNYPYPFVDKIAKLIPFELGITLQKALEQEPQLQTRYEDEEEVKEIIDLALKLEGITKNAGKHAGGVVIAPSVLTDFTAIYCEEGGQHLVSQFDKDDVEAVGLVKFDFLGLKTLTTIDWALNIINQSGRAQQSRLEANEIPTDDALTFELLKACKTTGVFQLESRGMKELIGRLQPDCFEDIIALVALFRPGPLQSGMVDDFINRKHKRAKVDYAHPDLEPILKPTYGVILYQEQVMQIAQVLANYTLGAADLLRRAMGKKKPEEMAKQRQIFTQGAVARGVAESVATLIFDLMEKFAGYGFNKSHSAAYALVAYQTAWIKAHYPAAFMAASMSADLDNTDKIVTFMDECALLKLKVLPPSINLSKFTFTVRDKHTLVYGLGAIKGVGQGVAESIVHEREQGEPYTDLFNFCKRLDSRKVNKRVLEALIKSGSFDEWSVDRASLMYSIEKALKLAEQSHQNRSLGQFELLSFLEEDDQVHQEYVDGVSWTQIQNLEGEKEVLGFYLTGHPTDVYRRELGGLITPLSQLPRTLKKAKICVQVAGIKTLVTKRGKKLGILNVEDVSGRLDVVVFEELLTQCKEQIVVGNIILIEGDIAEDTYSGGTKITAKQILDITTSRTQLSQYLKLCLTHEDIQHIQSLQSVLNNHPGTCKIQIDYSNEQARARLQLSQQWSVMPSDALIKTLGDLLGADKVVVCY